MAVAGCKFTVHCSTSFSTISSFAAIAQTKLRTAKQIRHLLDLNWRAALVSLQPAPPTRWRITNASRDGDECFCDERMLLSQSVKTVTHVVELLNFVHDRIRIHGVRGFL